MKSKSIGKIHLDVDTKCYLDDNNYFLLSTCKNAPNYLENYPYLDALSYEEFESKTETFEEPKFCKISRFLFTFRNLFRRDHYEFIKPLIKDGKVSVPTRISPLIIKNSSLFAALTPQQERISDLSFFKNYELFTGCTDKDQIKKMTRKYKKMKARYEKQRKESLNALEEIRKRTINGGRSN